MVQKSKTQGVVWTPGHEVPDLKSLHLEPEPLPHQHAWELAQMVFHGCFQELSGGRDFDVGKVANIGEGRHRTAHEASIELPGTSFGGTYAALVPKPGAPAELNALCLKEVALLNKLASLNLPFRVPRAIAIYQAWGYLVMIRERLFGVPSGRTWSPEKPWDVVAQVAAAIHQVSMQAMAGLVPVFDTCRSHGEYWLQRAGLRDEFPTVHAWLSKNLPSNAPTVLLHGDLRMQNLVLDFFDKSNPPGVLDWDYAVCGDPALDLAVVSAGSERPFDTDKGLDKLLKAYLAAGGRRVAPNAVRFYELCVLLQHYRRAADTPRQGDIGRTVLAVLKRASAKKP